MIRRYYSQSARDLLSKGFLKMENANHRKSPQERESLVAVGKKLKVPADVIRQAYDAAKPGEKTQSSESTRSSIAAARKIDVEMFNPEPSETFPRFRYDDLPSAAHLQLIEHRTYRQYVRTAAYEFPQLLKFRSKYHRPDPKTHNLHFKYFTFLGEDHPASRKVVLTFNPDNVPGLDAKQLHKLKLVAGSRYDMIKNEIKIASDRFAEQAQNKRYLGHLYQKLVSTAKDTTDSFEDVPLDPRHSLKIKRSSIYPSQHKFPEEWNRPDLAPKEPEDIVSVLGSRERWEQLQGQAKPKSL